MIKKLLNALICLVILWYWSDKIYYRMEERNQVIAFQPKTLIPNFSKGIEKNTNPTELTAGGIVIKANKQGHFTGTVFINDVAMPFMIDTGATETVIPVELANKAKLPIGMVGQSETAGGTTLNVSTQISSLKIGSAEIKNIKAHINYSLHEVLIGMNTLKFFSMSTKDDEMTLIASSNTEETKTIASDIETNEQENMQPTKKK
ncbi:MAG: TIGR02281 family clan AA aspartic protease, partial [Methylococcales bacterium]|nr:TIGR02281 family clan AA aspartic protease [Methylococcales bacterium]